MGAGGAIPPKLSASLSQYPLLLPLDDEHQNLRFIGELLIEDVVQTRDVEETFYRYCYCDSGALAQHSLISHNILRARYAALFDPAENQPLLSPEQIKKVLLSRKM